jgi:hypothetical protein
VITLGKKLGCDQFLWRSGSAVPIFGSEDLSSIRLRLGPFTLLPSYPLTLLPSVYSTCLYCHSNLGRNERLRHFPVGRRLAFDSAKGRLWVICGSCSLWNLSPAEERLETIDTCESLFRQTRIRVSTENIGMVELREGLSLIRIGKPLRPEFAAWRYSRHFARRRWKTSAVVTAVAGTAFGATMSAITAGFVGSAFVASYAAAWWLTDEGPKRRKVVTKLRAGGRLVGLTQDDAEASRVFRDGGREGFGLALHHREGVDLLRGDEVKRILARVVPALSPFGGGAPQVRGAIDLVDSAGSAEACITRTMDHAVRFRDGWFREFPLESRLALEMSLQEEGERRALEGELQILEEAWREAEEIATIADTLLVPGDVLERATGIRRGPLRRPGFALG